MTAPARPVAADGAAEAAASETRKVVLRLKRAQGQLAGVIRMLEDGRPCDEVVTQLSAVSKAVDRAGFAVIAAGMEQCLRQPEGDGAARVDELRKLFLSLT